MNQKRWLNSSDETLDKHFSLAFLLLSFPRLTLMLMKKLICQLWHNSSCSFAPVCVCVCVHYRRTQASKAFAFMLSMPQSSSNTNLTAMCECFCHACNATANKSVSTSFCDSLVVRPAALPSSQHQLRVNMNSVTTLWHPKPPADNRWFPQHPHTAGSNDSQMESC